MALWRKSLDSQTFCFTYYKQYLKAQHIGTIKQLRAAAHCEAHHLTGQQEKNHTTIHRQWPALRECLFWAGGYT